MNVNLYKVTMGLIEKRPRNVIRNYTSLNVLAASADVAGNKAVKHAQKEMIDVGKLFVDEVTNIGEVDLK